jgi:predicted nucleotidyltransferase
MLKRNTFDDICSRFGITLAYLFGSQVEVGEALLENKNFSVDEAMGDVDLGVVFIKFPEGAVRKVYGSIREELSPLFKPLELDLTFLQETDFLLQFEAIQGKSIYCINEDFQSNYEDRVMNWAADWKFEYDLYQREFLEAIRDGYFEIEYDANHR